MQLASTCELRGQCKLIQNFMQHAPHRRTSQQQDRGTGLLQLLQLLKAANAEHVT
jgi:hypothetical protein